MLSWLCMVSINIGESKKNLTHKWKYRREKFCNVLEETILFLIYEKAYYHHEGLNL